MHFSRFFRRVLPLIVVLTMTAFLRAQNDPSQSPFGISTNGLYSSYGIDTVNHLNGNVVVKIPLYSLPQRGKLKLSFSLVSNSMIWQQESGCPSTSSDCFNEVLNSGPNDSVSNPYNSFDNVCSGQCGFGDIYPNPLATAVVDDSLPLAGYGLVTGTFIEQICCAGVFNDPGDNIYATYAYADQIPSVSEPDGSTHGLYYDASYNAYDSSQSRTTDGSGYIFYASVSPYFYPGVTSRGGPSILVKPDGTKISFGTSASTTETDTLGNTLTYVSGSAPTGAYILDSLQRQIPEPYALSPTSITTGCPLPSPLEPNQLATESAKWTVPGPTQAPSGPNGASATYLICYTNVNIHTNFWGNSGQSTQAGNGQDTGFDDWDETVGTIQAIQSVVLPDGSYYQFTYDSADPNASPSNGSPYIAYGSLIQIHLPQGGLISYSYQFAEPPGVDGTIPVLVGRSVDDNHGNISGWSYSIPQVPSGTRYAVASEYDNAGNQTIYIFQPPSFDTNLTPSYPYTTTTYSGQGSTAVPLKSEQYNYTFTQAPYTVNVVGNALLTSTTTTLYGSGGSGAVSSTTSTVYDSGYFNADNLGTISGSPCPQNCAGYTPSGPLSLGIPLSTTVTDYSGATVKATKTMHLWESSPPSASPSSPYWTANILDAPNEIQEYDASGIGGTVLADTHFIYDEPSYSCSSAGYAGNVTTTTRWKTGGSSTSTHSAWDCYGFQTQKIDGNGNTTTITPDSTEIFAQAVTQPPTNGVPHIDHYTYDPNTGNMLTHTDQNGIQTINTYSDPLGRLTLTQGAAGTPSEMDVLYQYPSLAEVDAAADLNTKGDGLLKSQVQYDDLGRRIFSKSASGAVVRTAYDYFNLPCAVSNPTFTDPGNLSCSPSGNPTQMGTDGITYYARDALGRTIKQTNQDGSTETWLYSNNSTLFTDENSNSWLRTEDALGRLTNVVEPNSATTYYTYDNLGNLTCTAQDGGSGGTFSGCGSASASWRPRTFFYDGLSELTSSSNPETGTTAYGYDSNGNVQTKTDARSVTTTYSYDALNRVTGRSYANSDGSLAAPSDCFLYDTNASSTPANAVGRLTAEWTQPSQCPMAGTFPTSGVLSAKLINSYDPIGRVLVEQTCVLGNCSQNQYHPQSFSFDVAGNLTGQSDGFGLQSFAQSYDSGGRLTSLTSSWSDATHPPFLYGAQAFGAFGVTNATRGGNISITKGYDNRGRVTGMTVGVSQ